MNKKVLVVDDSKTMREIISVTLKQIGFEIIQAEDGQNALDVLGDTKINLVITDLNMPNMNGIELIMALRRKANYSTIPILMVTTESSQDKKMEGKTAGATGWIVKPFEPQKLIDVINKVCI